MSPRVTRTRATICATVLASVGVWAYAEAQSADTHGALAMNQQLAKVDGLSVTKAVEVPQGVSPAFWSSLVPKDNPGTPAQVALGKKLYFDTRLSKDGTVACATCHDVSRGFSDHRAMSEGVGGQVGRRNAPTTLNAAFFHTQFWDGRASTLEDQAGLPITNPIEMGQPNEAAALAAIAGDAQYQADFKGAY
ncbi:MAG TPA: cytochrome-c peroxidase, partial [Polyangiales bacterium]|nr:cytochrome-c peroxidase [Polyangiales bacterium]